MRQRRSVTASDGSEAGAHAEAARGEGAGKDRLSVLRQACGKGSRGACVVDHNHSIYQHVYEPLQCLVKTFINDFDILPYDATIGDGSLNTTSDSLNDTYADVHFQQREYDHGGGQDGQSDVMFNIDPDNHFHTY